MTIVMVFVTFPVLGVGEAIHLERYGQADETKSSIRNQRIGQR